MAVPRRFAAESSAAVQECPPRRWPCPDSGPDMRQNRLCDGHDRLSSTGPYPRHRCGTCRAWQRM